MAQTWPQTKPAGTAALQPVPGWLARRRWARAGLIHTILLALSILFMGPLLFAALSSLKDNPTEWPPSLSPHQLSPRNWMAAYRLGKQGGGSGWFGGFEPGHALTMELTYLVPPGQEETMIQVAVPRRVAGAGAAAVRTGPFASDVAVVSPVEVVRREPREDGTAVTYRFTITNASEDVAVDRVPLDVTKPREYVLLDSTLPPNRVERRGQVHSWNNVAGGLIRYVFYNYHRVFTENYSRSTGRNLFLTWIGNSFLIAGLKVLTTLAFASLAGYALARMRFPGKNALFVFMLFSMMLPNQVLFISNYLVLRDGIFGLSKLWGGGSLLNTFTGLILSGLVGASAVFIMRQFFISLPRELEESARIDGATPWQTFTRVVLPLAKPALGALTIMTFQGAWNDFFWPLVVLTAPQDKFTLTVGLLSFRLTYGVAFDWGPILAGAVISALPIVILFAVFQRYFVEGISFSGLKG